ncbi:glycosyltransferase [Sulfurimonas sp.]|jgi:cellulose synthase/poly-beta-1,6-N-acetylglucosamine synthase-like glycosyltransferase|uniref:glycosyltransferase n=1 Tax=Sulfurimonas sp. TaxID=2022749 RepID=UPI0025EEDC97|nr:glycosyltransferase [Sulfurimonas sp.]MBT5935562.1 glycosyltransferase [Sulfurimonas sp.]
MLVTVIIPTYKDVEALRLILDALQLQTYKNFEVLVAEDDDSKEVSDFLVGYSSSFVIKHHSQKDEGWKKARALNAAILLSEGEYLIFFDGDCLPYSTFVDGHVKLSEPNNVLCGRRVNTGDMMTQQLREKVLSITKIEKDFFSFWSRFKADGARHIEQGIYLSPKNILYVLLIKLLDRKKTLVGCNFSAFKSDMLKINGFDESYPSGDIADDIDVEWRLNSIGVKNKSCRYAANLIHLNHDRTDRKEAHKNNFDLMLKKQKNKTVYCKDGIIKSYNEPLKINQ